MEVKAKFQVISITDYGTTKTVNMQAVYGTEGENAAFTKFTPSGQLQIGIDTDAPAVQEFTLGKVFYLTFTAAE